MPASTKHILTNVERMAGDVELLKLWNAEAQTKNEDGTERTAGQAWMAFIEAADAARSADRIPGSVGKAYRAKYAAESSKGPAKKTSSTRRTSSKAAGK